MTSPGGKDRHGFVAVTEPARAHPQRIPGRSHEKAVWPRGRAFEPVPVALLAAAYFGAAKVGQSIALLPEQVICFRGRSWCVVQTRSITSSATLQTKGHGECAVGIVCPLLPLRSRSRG